MRGNRIVAPPPESGLERLLRLERQLASRLADARVAADRLLAEAKTRAAAAVAGEELAGGEADTALLRRLTEERESTMASLKAQGERTLKSLKRLDGARIQGLADRVLDRLVDESAPGCPL